MNFFLEASTWVMFCCSLIARISNEMVVMYPMCTSVGYKNPFAVEWTKEKRQIIFLNF